MNGHYVVEIEMVGANMVMIVSIDMSLVCLETNVKTSNVPLAIQRNEISYQIQDIDQLGMFFMTNVLKILPTI